MLVRIEQPRAAPSGRRAAIWGTMTGYTTFVAHSGGPPLAIYLLPQRLDKTVFAGTSAVVFMLANIAKQVPYLYLGYWINGSPKMSYKRRFQPQEQLTGNGWVRS